ncbi:TetR/AcrR family transcriptional regulator [Nocardioides marmoribigeumensis]|jgi:AcrR family transcriptional regulator
MAPDARREEIITAAARLFEQRPWTQVSTVEVAREAGIARGLLNHYFVDKRGLYLAVVRRWLLVPAPDVVPEDLPEALPDRVDIAVRWFLDSVALPAASNYAVFGTEGVADDLEVAAILDQADDLAARRVLQLVGLDAEDELSRAQVRAYGGLAKATAREWARRGALTREQAHRLLRDTLLFLVDRIVGVET